MARHPTRLLGTLASRAAAAVALPAAEAAATQDPAGGAGTPAGPVPTREIFGNIHGWMEAVFYAVAALSSAVLLYGLWRRLRKYRRGRAEPRFDRLGRRLWRAVWQIATSSTVRRGDGLAGLAHALIVWGFVVLLIGTTLVAIDYDILRPLGVRMLQGPFYLGFSLVLDVGGVLFILGLLWMVVRRARGRLPQLDYARADARGGAVDRRGYATDDMLFVVLLLAIAVTGFAVEGARIAPAMPDFERFSLVGYGLAALLQGMSADALVDAHVWCWWLHALLVMAFLAYLPFSKAVHMVTDVANLVFADRLAARRLPPLPAAKPSAGGGAPAPQMGYARITDFTWKELLDLDACTKCGRCHVACPARAAGTTLSPRDLILDLRSFATEALSTPEWFGQRFGAGSNWPSANAASAGSGGNGSPAGDGAAGHGGADGAAVALADVDVAMSVIRPETLWSCTTCMACVAACPVGIEHLTHIVQLRRRLVDRGAMDDNLSRALVNLGEYGNSFGESKKKRARWTKGLSFAVPDARVQPVDWLWFVGDFASYDPRVQANSRLVAEALHRGGVDFGLLHDGERNAGNDVRRVGEEGLFEQLVEENLEALRGAQFARILTTDPHTLNTLRHEYRERGLQAEVHHYSRVLLDLVQRGALPVLRRPRPRRVTYHDPCYLARYNGEIEAPRQLLAALGVELVDMPRCGANTFCCGAGGGRIWMDTSNESKRTSEQRIEEALALGDLDAFVTACPKDFAMYSDAVKTLGVADRLPVVDLAQLVAEATAAAAEAG